MRQLNQILSSAGLAVAVTTTKVFLPRFEEEALVEDQRTPRARYSTKTGSFLK